MDVEEIQAQACKYSRVGNGSSRSVDHSNKLVVQKGGGGAGGGGVVEQYPDDEDQDGDIRRIGIVGSVGCEAARLRGWHHSSRIFRVSRASGGKDRHSKVLTSKGLRDRRVRLSVSTAISFYDLQDRLGYDQPSKAVEWLIKAAEEAIAELPSLNSPFPDTPPKQLSDGKRESAGGTEQGVFDSADIELEGEYPNYQQQQQQQHQRQLSLSKSACSSTSETSKGSGLSLSRSDVRVNRVKARERARERAAKEKENESRVGHLPNNNVSNPISQNSSFTELLTGGISSVSNNNNTSSTSASAQQSPGGGGGGGDDGPSLFHKSPRQWPSSTSMDYFNSTGLFGSSRTTHHSNSGFSSQIQLGNSHLPPSMIVPQFTVAGDNHHHHHHPPELQQFSFMPDHLIPVAASQPGGNENYNLNFTISSSGLAGFNRGTLQSNSSVPSMSPHLQRFSPIDGSSNVPFFIGAAAAAASPMENNNNHHHHYHQFAPAFDGRLHLYNGDGTRHSDQKGKGKN